MSSTSPNNGQTRQIKASVLHGAKDLRIESRSLPPPLPHEIQATPLLTGLCGSDLHYYNHYRNGDIPVLQPLSLGHETIALVTSLGSSVSSLRVGDRVALEVGLPCNECERCREGRYNICGGLRFRSSAKGGLPHAQGTLQEGLNHPEGLCHKLPERSVVSDEEGALLEPLCVAVQAHRRARLSEDAGEGEGKWDSVLVFGAGAVGLLVAGVAKMRGARRVVVVDVDQGRVDFAVENGFADRGFMVQGRRGKDAVEEMEIARETAGQIGEIEVGGKNLGKVDAIFECTGVASCLQAALLSLRAGGRIMLIGMGNPIQTLPISQAVFNEFDIIGVFRYANCYPEAIRVISQKTEDGPQWRKLVTHRYRGLESVPRAFDMASKTKDDEGKLVIKVVVDTASGQAELAAKGRL